MKAVYLLSLTLMPALYSQAPAPRVEFEVASVKVSPAVPDGSVNVGVYVDGAMVRCNYLSLRNYLTIAYDVKDYQIAGPDWLASDHFDISAKIPAGPSGEASLRAMMKSLLEDRFKLVQHRETRDLPEYALIVGKNGLKIKELPADATTDDNGKVDVNVTGGGRGGTVVNLGAGSYLSYNASKLEAHHVTFASIMESLSKFLDRPVVDMTGLTGKYDFTLDYSIEELRNLVRSYGADASRIPDSAGDPSASIFTSLEGIGLKLDPRKAPVEVLVVDRAERVPTAN